MSYITVKEASEYLKKSEQYIRRLLSNSSISGKKFGNIWMVDDSILNKDSKSIKDNKGLTENRICKKKKHKSKPIALSFFSGAMGLDIGLEKAGIDIFLTSEIDKSARQTIVFNEPNIGLIDDIRNFSADEIRRYAGLENGDEIDFIVGGPPCQAFSTAGKRMGFSDERGNVFLTYIDRILELKPKFAVIENVRGLLSAPLEHRPHDRRGFGYPPLTPEEEKGGALLHIIHKLEEGGYKVNFNLYNAANFGSPQKRERVILICSRENIEIPFLEPTNSENGEYNLQPWRTFKEVAKGLKESEQTYIEFPEKRIKYYKLLGPGQYWKHLPEELQKEALGKSYFAGGGKTGFLRRIAWDKPSPTLVTHPAMPATDLAHPVENRPLSIQEYKRVQEFPDNWKLGGTITDQYKQIGNAVPTSLGYAVGKHLIKLLNHEKIEDFSSFNYSRYKNTSYKEFIDLMNKRNTQKEALLV